LVRIRVAGSHERLVALPVDLGETVARVVLRQQALDRLHGWHVRIAVVEVAIRERKIHRLVQRVNVACAVVPHAAQVDVLEQVQRLQHHGTLNPVIQLVDVDSLVSRDGGIFDMDLPAIEILHRDQPAGGLRLGDDLLRDVAAIEALVGGKDRLLAILAGFQRGALRVHELGERSEQLRLLENLARVRCGPRLRPLGIVVR
jgi:hypothetical protein